jgi:peptidylprolyl isomerase
MAQEGATSGRLDGFGPGSDEKHEDAVLRFVERFALLLNEAGLPRMAARVFGYVLADDAESYSARELAVTSDSAVLEIPGTRRSIVGEYIPVGATEFQVQSTDGLRPGDDIVVVRNVNEAWLTEIGMDNIPERPGRSSTRQWTVPEYIIGFQRVIKEVKENTIVIDTTKGRIVIKLRNDIAPQHAERIKLLAREGYYNNVPFHRVIEGFMAQTGDGKNFNGTGGSKHPNLPAEFSNVPYKRGIVGMARRGDSIHSANSQFFIMYAENSGLNNQYTVIGEVVSGMDAVDRIKKGSEAMNGAVTDPDRIVRMRVAADAR